MEVKEVRVPNSGINDFPMLLKSIKVPKAPVLPHYPGMFLKKEDYYLPSDLIVENVIEVYGR